jgi:hypothetical protein
MKKIFYITAVLALVSFFPACEPIVEEANVGEVVTSVEQIQAEVNSVVVNGKKTNRVAVKCASPVVCQWTDGVNTLSSNDGELTLLVEGQQTIEFKALAADGAIFTKEFNVTVEDMYYPVSPAYGFFFGSGTKTWVWNSAAGWEAPEGGPAGAIIMSGGSPSSGRDYWGWTPEDLSSQCQENGYPDEGAGSKMVLTLKGKKIVKYGPAGTVVGQGNINFDLTPTSVYGSLGTITFVGTNILFPYDRNGNVPWSFNTFTITYLDDDHLMLFTPSSNGGWYYVFNAESWHK